MNQNKKSLGKKFLAAFATLVVIMMCTFSFSAKAVEAAIAPGSDGHGHWHGSIFHCSGTPIDCHNP